jgi:hypothetical protein
MKGVINLLQLEVLNHRSFLHVTLTTWTVWAIDMDIWHPKKPIEESRKWKFITHVHRIEATKILLYCNTIVLKFS